MHHSLSHPISSAYTKEEELIERIESKARMHAEPFQPNGENFQEPATGTLYALGTYWTINI
jgi:hypothetical protein